MSDQNELKKEDRRVRRTKKLLTQALTQLLREKQVKDITVKELTELADMNAWTENPLIATGNSAEVYAETTHGLDALFSRYGYHRKGALYATEHNTDVTIALFCHFGISMNIMSYLLRIPFHLLLHGFIMAPSSITTLVTEERIPGEVWFRCTALGDTTHLSMAGEPISHYGRYWEQYGIDDGLGAKE